MFFELSMDATILIFIIGLFIGGTIGAALGYGLYHHNVYNMQKRVDLREAERKNNSLRYNEKYNEELKKAKQAQKNNATVKDSNISDREKMLDKRENALNEKEEILNDREMALAEGLDEIVVLKDSVDAIIKAQQDELFGYCSVSEEFGLKMKEITLEVQKKLKETVEKIQE